MSEPTLRRILRNLSLAWDHRVLKPHESNRTILTHSISQVKHQVYTYSVGSWRKYAHELPRNFVSTLKAALKNLKDASVLPFESTMNWELNVNFDYEMMAHQSFDNMFGGQTRKRNKSLRDQGEHEIAVNGNEEDGAVELSKLIELVNGAHATYDDLERREGARVDL